MAQAARVFVGTYTESMRFGTGELFEGQGEGIHVFELDPEAGELTPVNVVRGVRNPSFLCFDRSGDHLYAVNELKRHDKGEGGTVSAFSVRGDGTDLSFLGLQPTGGTDPCHVSIDNSGRYVMVANYMSGSVSVYPRRADGSLERASAFVQHSGSSVDSNRQEGPHAHSSVFDAANRFVFVSDLGADRVIAYRFDSATGGITEEDGGGIGMEPGAGPRHIVFDADGAFAYVVNELHSTVTVCRFYPESGRLEQIQSRSTLPAGFSGDNDAAGIELHPSGSFLYVSNRGDESIATFRRDPASGELELVGHVACGGETPRHFALDPTGSLLLVGNQGSDSIVAFRIDPSTGLPEATGRATTVGTPVCIVFAP